MNILLPCINVNDDYNVCVAVMNIKNSKFFRDVLQGYSDTVKEIATRHDNGFVSVNFSVGSDIDIVFGDACPIEDWDGGVVILDDDFDFDVWSNNAIDDVLSRMTIDCNTIVFEGEGGTMGNRFSTDNVTTKWFLNNL